MTTGLNSLKPTRKATPRLRDELRHPWYVPLPLTADEQADFLLYLTTHGVPVKTVPALGGGNGYAIVATEDLSPHARAWRVERGDCDYTEAALEAEAGQ